MEDIAEEEEEESMADRARLLDSDSEPEQPDPVAARATIAPYLEDVDSYMRSLEVSEGLSIPLLAETWVRKSELVLAVGLPGLQFTVAVMRLALRRPRDYMLPVEITQGAITPTKRAKVVDWLVEVAGDFKLLADTLHLAVSYFDRFLSVGVIISSELQLLGVTALLVAAKFENDMHKVGEYSDITDNTYTKQQVVKMEADILKLLKFEMGSPTARTFLRFVFILQNRTLQRKTGYKVSDLECCISTIHELQLIGGYPGLEEEAIKLKYSHSELESVSAMASPRKIPEKFLKDIKQ
ncbi:hypothetical protein QYE76_037372 [Lolium multiflorum]|uniref:Cyclin-like domain-containing protein n=1 Tax=Lolium multiflorum TaxID=4521 RepID=A0AAD8QHP3_LOLMU|nr:hypothetical protein QYE76_037372 [Lolium multiflorum]